MSRLGSVDGEALVRRLSWTTLLALLVGLCFFSPFFERPEAQRFVGESTLLMAAESLAWDGDLRYSRGDFDRHVLLGLREPPDLALASGHLGLHWTYDVSPAAALWLAPFVRGWPQQGFAVANCLLLLGVGLVTAAHWQRERGVLGPLTLALCLAASLVLGALFVADGGLFHFAATLLAFTLLTRPMAEGRLDWPAWAAGALLALPVMVTALHGWLAVAALWMSSRRRHRSLILAFFGMLMVLGWVQNWEAVGGWPLDRQVFRTSTGFPLVDFEGPADLKLLGRGDEVLAVRPGGPETAADGGIYVATQAWALVDRLIGHRLGVLLFFPLVLPLLCRAWQVRRRRPLLWVSLAWLLTLVAVAPRDLEMGGISWAGGLWLPVYGGLVASLGWVAPRQTESTLAPSAWRPWPWRPWPWRPWPWRPWPWRPWPWIVTVGIAAVLACWTLPDVWRDPWRVSTSLTESLTDSGLASPWPLETTQESVLLGDRLENRGQTWVQLDSATWVEAENRRLILPADRVSHWLLVSEGRLGQEDLENVFADWQVLGFSRSFGASDVPVRQGLGIRVTMESRWPRRHGVGWTRQPQWLYRLRLLPVVEGSHPELAYLALYCAADERPPELD